MKLKNERKKEKLFCSIHERPTIGDCFPAAAAFSALSTGEGTFMTFSFQFFFEFFFCLISQWGRLSGIVFLPLQPSALWQKANELFWLFLSIFPLIFLFNFIVRPTIGDCFAAATACSALSTSERTFFNFSFQFFFSIFLFNFSFLQFYIEADYRGFFIANAAFGHN